MSLSNTVPIGNSIVHVLESSGNNQTPPLQTLYQEHPSDLPCLLLPRDSRRILLQGPERSGRTSLVMNLAYSCASRQSSSCHCMAHPCRCSTVFLYRKSRVSSLDDDFPMPCHDSRLFNTKKDLEEYRIRDWELDTLRRIRIEYVSSARELLQDMLGLLGKPWQDQPIRAILIDDLDQICQNDNNNEDDGRGKSGGVDNASIIHIMQTLAVAVDTSHAIYRLHGTLPIVLASVSLKAKVVAPWMETIITLSPSSSSSSRNTKNAQREEQAHQPGFRTRWQAEFQGRASELIEKPWHTVIDYSIITESADGPRIEWEAPDGHGR